MLFFSPDGMCICPMPSTNSVDVSNASIDCSVSFEKRLESLKFVGGYKIMKELLKTVFFAAYESVVFSSGKSVKDKEQKEMLCCSILATEDPDVVSLPEQIVFGVYVLSTNSICTNLASKGECNYFWSSTLVYY